MLGILEGFHQRPEGRHRRRQQGVELGAISGQQPGDGGQDMPGVDLTEARQRVAQQQRFSGGMASPLTPKVPVHGPLQCAQVHRARDRDYQ